MPCLVAHRGQKFSFPENTLVSIHEAIRCGAVAVEFDVQMTADRVPVICHDPSLLRTAGVDIIITDVNYADIKDISVGEAGRFAEKFQSITLPSMQAMVAILKDSPQVQVFVELKNKSFDVFGVEGFLNPVISQLEPVKQHCVVIADNLHALLLLRQQTSIPIGWIIHRWHNEDLTLAKQNEVDYLVINHKYYNPELDYDFAADSWDWMIYDTCEPDMASSLFDMGVSFVETSDVCSMLKRVSE